MDPREQPPEPAGITPSYSPLSGVVVAADGTISYDFEGHISAEGVDLPLTNSLSLPETRVNWIDENGDSKAHIVGFDPIGALPTLQVQAGSAGAMVLDAQGNSAFVRQNGGGGKLSIAGIYTVDSGALAPGTSSYYTLAHNLGKLVYPLASNQDAFLAYSPQISWRYLTIDLFQIQFAFEHTGTTPGAAARFHFFLLTNT